MFVVARLIDWLRALVSVRSDRAWLSDGPHPPPSRSNGSRWQRASDTARPQDTRPKDWGYGYRAPSHAIDDAANRDRLIHDDEGSLEERLSVGAAAGDARERYPLPRPYSAPAPPPFPARYQVELAWIWRDAEALADFARTKAFLRAGGQLVPMINHTKMIREVGVRPAARLVRRLVHLTVQRGRLYSLRPGLVFEHAELFDYFRVNGWFRRPEAGPDR